MTDWKGNEVQIGDVVITCSVNKGGKESYRKIMGGTPDQPKEVDFSEYPMFYCDKPIKVAPPGRVCWFRAYEPDIVPIDYLEFFSGASLKVLFIVGKSDNELEYILHQCGVTALK